MDLWVKWYVCMCVCSYVRHLNALIFFCFDFIQLIHQLATSQVWLLNSVGHAYSFNQLLACNAPIFFPEHLYKTSTCFVYILWKGFFVGHL